MTAHKTKTNAQAQTRTQAQTQADGQILRIALSAVEDCTERLIESGGTVDHMTQAFVAIMGMTDRLLIVVTGVELKYTDEEQCREVRKKLEDTMTVIRELKQITRTPNVDSLNLYCRTLIVANHLLLDIYYPIGSLGTNE